MPITTAKTKADNENITNEEMEEGDPAFSSIDSAKDDEITVDGVSVIIALFPSGFQGGNVPWRWECSEP